MLNYFDKDYLPKKIMNKIQKAIDSIEELQKENEYIKNYCEDNEVDLVFDENGSLHKKFRHLEGMKYKNKCKIANLIGNLHNFDRYFDIPLGDLLYLIKENLEKEYPFAKTQINLDSSFIKEKLSSDIVFDENGRTVPGIAKSTYQFGYEFFDDYKKERYVLPKITVTSLPYTSAEEFLNQTPIVNILDIGLVTNNPGHFKNESWKNLFLNIVWDNLTGCSQDKNEETFKTTDGEEKESR